MRMLVEKLQHKQADVSSKSQSNSKQLERPLSEYDNITSAASSSHIPHVNIRFRFDDLPEEVSVTNITTAMHRNTDNKETLAHYQYENVLETLQLRNSKREENQQVKMSQTEEKMPQRSVMSVAKSSFFGLDSKHKNTAEEEEELNKLIDDIGNVRIMSKEQNQYVNILPSGELTHECKQDGNISATSSVSGSSSTTVTPTASPVRVKGTECSRKNSLASNRSKSPKFMLPESSPSSPSQTVYMSTTVPQSIKKQHLGGRHKPTRQSLRHSRMLVTSKYIHGDTSENLLNIRYYCLAKFVLILKIIVGIALVLLGGSICLLAYSTPIQQNPFWSGLVIILSGGLGLYLLTFKKTRSRVKANLFWFLKMNASIIILMSVFLTVLAFIYASFHYMTLTSDNKKCFPENVFINSSSCICIFNVQPDSIITRESIETRADSSGQIELSEEKNIVHFRDLSCNELSMWEHIILTSMILNFLGLVLAVCYMTQFIFGCKKRQKDSYKHISMRMP